MCSKTEFWKLSLLESLEGNILINVNNLLNVVVVIDLTIIHALFSDCVNHTNVKSC